MTVAVVPTRHLFLRVGDRAVFGALHTPPTETDPTGTGVLILPPWGWDEVASHRERLAWADHLAARGHQALRIDLPGTGDSSGGPMDGGLVDAWVAAAAAAVAWLRAEQGVARVVVIGLGLGALIAADAIAGGSPVDDLVWWGAPSDGRGFVREARAFGLLQSRTYGVKHNGYLPEGAMEVSGFVLSSETASRLSHLDPTAMPTGFLRRALLLSRDRLPAPSAHGAHLSKLGVAVRVEPADGWAAMCVHPERFAPPTSVFRRVDDWLAAPVSFAPGGDRARQIGPAVSAEPSWSTASFVEETVQLGGGATLFGVLDRPTGAAPRLAAVFLDAGAVRHIGPNRMWVDAARRWAGRGVATLRIDVEAIGEAGGDAGRYSNVAEFYRPEVGQQVLRFLRVLDERWPGTPRLLIGLCAGGYWGIQIAAHDRATIGAVLVNAGALVWDAGLLQRRRARGLSRLSRTGGWARLLEEGVSLRRVGLLIAALTSTAVRGVTRTIDQAIRRVSGRDRPDEFAELFAAVGAHGGRLMITFSGDEPLEEELRAGGIMRRASQMPNVTFGTLPGSDHTLRPIEAQQALHQLLDDVIGAAWREASG